MRNRLPKSPSRAAGPTIAAGQPILALEKRIAFDGAAVATTARAAKHAIDASHFDGPAHDGGSASHLATDAKTLLSANLWSRDLATHDRSVPAQPKSVVFIESNVPDVKTLIKDIDPSAQIVMLDASKDGVDAIASYLSTHAGIQNVYIFSHGSDAHLSLGTADLNSATMQGMYAQDLATIKASLGANANILVYGCDFAQYADGDAAARLLSTLTGASVAASTNLTGGSASGGDFVLEDRIGTITAPNILNLHIADDYHGLLATQNSGAFTVTTGTDATATSNQTVATATTADGAVKIVVTVTPNANNSANSITTKASGATFDTTAPSTAYTTTLNGAAALEETLAFGGSGSSATDGTNSATISIAYFDAKTGAAITVTNPIINIDRLGGSATNSANKAVSNSSNLTVTTAGATLTSLASSSSAFNVTSTDVYETVNTAIGSGYSSDANADPTKGTAAGTVQVNGSYSTLTFNWSKAANAINGAGDRIDLIFSADTSISAASTLPNQTYKDGQSGISIATSQGFTEPTGLNVTYTASGLPTGLTIDSATGIISGTIDHDASKNGQTTSGSGATLDGTYNVVVTATNSAGNAATQAFTIDSTNQAPTVGTKTVNQTSNDGATITSVDASKAFTDPNGDPLTYTASNLPSGLSISSAGLISGTVAKNATPGTYAVVVKATDDKGASATETFNWVVKDVPPTAAGTLPNQTFTDGQANISFATSQGFADSVGNALTYSATGLPKGLSINSATGQITGTIDHDASKNAPATTGSGATLDGKYTIVETVSDGLGGTATQTFTIDSTNQAPTVAAKTANQTNNDGDTITAVDASKAFTDPNGDPLTFAASGLPTGLSISSAGLITGTVAKNAAPGTYSVVVTATDDKGAATSETFTWLIKDVPPAKSGTLPNQTYTDGQSNIAILTSQGFTDSLGNALSYSATGLPTGLSIDPTTGKITGTVDHDASKNAPTKTGSGATLDGKYTVIVTASDGLGGTATQTFTIDSTNQAPTVSNKTADQTNNDGDTITAVDVSTAFTDPNGDPLTFTASNLPNGLVISSAGKISGTVNKTVTPGTYAVVVTATDDKGAATTETFNWIIKSIPPQASGTLPNQTYTDGQTGIAIATAQGFVDTLGNTLTYSASGLPTGLAIDAVSGKITGTIDHDASKNAPTTTGAGATLDGKYTIVVTASDGKGGTATQTFTIDATNQAPSVTTKTTDQTNSDGDTVTPVDASKAFKDSNGDPLTYSVSNLPPGLSMSAAGVISGKVKNNAAPGTYAVVVTATDDKGAATSETFNWTIKDIPPTTSGTLANQAYTDGQAGIAITTMQGFSDSLGNTLTYSATGLPKGLTIDATTGKITGTIDHDASKNAPTTNGSGATLYGTYTVVVTASDGLGGTATQSFTVDSSNQAPVTKTITANQASNAGQTISPVDTSAAFSDPNTGDILTYSASNLPPGLTIDPSSGVISGKVAPNAKPGSYTVGVVATDDKGAFARESFTWTVADVPPTTAAQLPNLSFSDATPGISIDTTSGFNSPNGVALTYSATGLPAGLSIDSASGRITGALDHNASANAPVVKGSGATLDGTYTVTITVSDGQGGTASQSFTLDSKNDAPTLSNQTPDQHGSDGNIASVDAAAAFVDKNTGDVLTYSATGLPPGLSIDPSTGLITGTLAANASRSSPYAVSVTVTDNKGATTTERFAWTVENVGPVATPPLTDRAAYDGNAVNYTTAGGFTNPNGLPLTYSASGLPTGVTIDSKTGVISGTLDHDASTLASGGAYTIAVTVNDGQGGTATNTFHLTVTNQAPVVVKTTPNQTAVDGQSITAIDVSNVFTDPNGDPLTYTASGLPAGLAIDSSGKITGTVASNVKPGTYTTTVSATDDKGLAASETFTWTVSDVAPVTSSTLPAGTYADSAANISIQTASGFISPNGLKLTYSATGLPAGLSIDPTSGLITGQLDHDASKNAPVTSGSGATLDGTYTISVTADDGQGGTATQRFTLDAKNTAPALTAQTPTQNGSDGSKVSLDAAAAFTDSNIGDVVTYSATGLPSGLTIDTATGLISGTLSASASRSGPFTVVVTATDDKGAATSEQFTWQVTDVAPTATGALGDRTAHDGSAVSYATDVGFTHPNGLSLTYTATGLPTGLSINQTTGVISGTIDRNASTIGGGTYAITVAVDDGQGGTASTTFHLTATNQAPTVTTSTGNQSSTDGQTITPLSIAGAFTDPNGDPLTFAASNLPKGLSIDASGTISGTIAANATPGTYVVTITATDSKGVATPETFTWTVADAPPVVATTLANQTVKDSQANISIDTSTGFTSPNGLALRYTVTGLPTGLAIDANTGMITGQIDHDASKNGTYSVVVKVDDGQGGTASQTFTIDSTNQAPVASSVSLDQHSAAGNMAQVDAAIAFSDPNLGDVLTYTIQGQPSGLSIDSSSGLITGTISSSAGSLTPYSVVVTATDDKGASVTKTVSWLVDTPVGVTTPIPNLSLYDGATPAAIDTATHFSNPSGLPLTYMISGQPSGLNIDQNTGKITGQVASDASQHGANSTGSGATLDSTYTVTVTATDSNNSQTQQTFVIDVANQAPIVAQKTVDQTTASGAAATVDISHVFSDPNGDSLTYAVSGLPSGLQFDSTTNLISGTTAATSAGTYAVTITATDTKGAVASETFAWTVTDTAPARSGTLANQTYADSSQTVSIATKAGFVSPNGLTLTYTASGLPDGLSIDPSTGVITGALGHDASISSSAGNGIYNVTVTASDGHGGSVTQTFEFDATNQAPTLAAQTADQRGADGASASVDVRSAFKDPNLGDTLTFSATGLPPGLTIDQTTGLISGTIATNASKAGPYTVVVKAVDDKGAATTESFTYTIGTVPPVAIPLGDQSAYDASAVSIATKGGFTNPNAQTLTYSATGLPTGLSIDPATGLISGNLQGNASTAVSKGIYTITVTANDGQNGVATNTFHIVATNQAPVVSARTVDQTSSDGQAITSLDASAAFHDPNGDVMTYSASNLPKGLTIDSTTGKITGTIAATAATTSNMVTVTATDSKGAAESETFLWTVNDTAPAKIGSIPAQSFADSASGISIQTAGTFATPKNLPYVFSATGLPAGLSIDPKTGVISGQIGHDASAKAPVTSTASGTLDGTYTVIVSAYDGQGGTSTQQFTIDAKNTAPAVQAKTPDALGYNGRTASLDAGAAFHDANIGDTLSFTATGLPQGLTIDPATGLITGTIDKMASSHGPYSVTVTATDDKGAATSETFVWTVDNIAPIATPPLPNLAAYDAATVNLTTVNGFTNPNAMTFTYSATGLPSGLSIDPTTGVISGKLNHDASVQIANGAYTIAVTATDGLGGSATNTFVLTATNQAAVVTAKTADQSVQTGQTITPLNVATTFRDPNGDPLTYAAYNLPSGLSIDAKSGMISGTVGNQVAPGRYEVTVLATDDKGAVTSETFQYLVDDQPPVAVGTIANRIYPDSTGNVSIPTQNGFMSPDGSPLTYSATGLPAGLAIDPTTGLISGFMAHDASKNAPVTTGFGASLEGIYTVTVTASDGFGTTASQTFMIEATNQAPSVAKTTPAQSNVDNDVVTLDISRAFSDPNIGDVLTFTANGLPKGLSLDPATGLISGTIDPRASQAGAYTVTVTATDDKGAATSETFQWTVANLPPQAISSPAAVEASDGSVIAPIDTAASIANPNGLPLTYSATGLPAGLTIDPATGRITGTLDHDASQNAPVTSGSGATLDGTYTVVVSASDGQGGVATETFTIDATNQAPQVVAPTPAQSSTDRDAIHVDTSSAFKDPNAGDVLTYAATGLPAGLSIDPASGLIEGTIDAKASLSGPYTVTVTATDDKGAATSETFAWKVANLAPYATSSPASLRAGDGMSVAPIDTAAFIANPNGLPLTFRAAGLPSGLSIDPVTGRITGTLDRQAAVDAPSISGAGAMLRGTYTIVVTASDGQGGTATETFTLDATNQAPVVTTPTANRTSDVGHQVAVVDTGSAFVDPNGDPLTFSATGLPAGLTIDPTTGLISGVVAGDAKRGIYTVTVTATDDKGATTSEVFDWYIESVSPNILGQPSFAPMTTTIVASPTIERDRPVQPDLHASGAVLDAVNQISGADEQSLVIRADEIVVSTVNNLRPLNGLQDLNEPGRGIVRAGAGANEEGDRYLRTSAGLSLDLAAPIAPSNVLGASLRDSSILEADAGATINVETLIRDRVLTIALDNASDIACVVPVASYDVTRADGSPLPAWLRAEAKNVLVGKIPSGVETIDLRIRAKLANGIVSERHVTIGTNSGSIRPAGAPRHEGRLLSDMIAAQGAATTQRHWHSPKGR